MNRLLTLTANGVTLRTYRLEHNTRLYGGTPQPIDDLLPTTLVWYTVSCQASEAYALLAGLFPKDQSYSRRSTTCESLPAPHHCADELTPPAVVDFVAARSPEVPKCSISFHALAPSA
jgi:hypothetical protein